MSYAKDPRVDAYFASLPDWQRDLFERLRDLIHQADPEIEETIKRTVQPYFVLQGNVAAFLAAKDHVSVFLYDPIAPIRRGSSPPATATRPAARSATARVSRSTRSRSST